jgi:hypothetical protein
MELLDTRFEKAKSVEWERVTLGVRLKAGDRAKRGEL